MITIIDYGAGNLFSVQNALNFLGVENNISSKVEDIVSADNMTAYFFLKPAMILYEDA